MTLLARTRSCLREDRHLAKTASPIKVTAEGVGNYSEEYKFSANLEYRHRGKR